MHKIQSYAQQLLQGIKFIHSMNLTHTDLKVISIACCCVKTRYLFLFSSIFFFVQPENILLKFSETRTVNDKSKWPQQVFHKRKVFGSSYDSAGSDEEEEDAEKLAGAEKDRANENYTYSVNDTIKIIDFGGATYANDHHSKIINTRQYRAPEVILQCCDWNEKSDIWSVACILIELYTGELFFPTHENVEHLAMIEKACGRLNLQNMKQSNQLFFFVCSCLSGAFPRWMCRSSEEFRRCFDLDMDEEMVARFSGRLNWPKEASSRKSIEQVDEMKTLSVSTAF